MIEFQANKSECRVYLNGMHALTMQIPEGCEDRYEQIGEFAFRWYRKNSYSCNANAPYFTGTL